MAWNGSKRVLYAISVRPLLICPSVSAFYPNPLRVFQTQLEIAVTTGLENLTVSLINSHYFKI